MSCRWVFLDLEAISLYAVFLQAVDGRGVLSLALLLLSPRYTIARSYEQAELEDLLPFKDRSSQMV